MKTVFDMILATVLVILFLPLYLIVACIVLVSMGRPILFKQQRAGLGGKPFVIYKFKTMKYITDSKGVLLPDEQRLTKAGHFLRSCSLDELPQLFNVLKGELSLVGPRPLYVKYVPLYSSKQRKRLDVKPGLTGWAQVNGRNGLSWEERFEMDVWYVENRTFGTDLLILWKTLVCVLQRTGISGDGSVTMVEFKGNINQQA